MKVLIPITFLILLSISAHSQTLAENEIIGSWIAKNSAFLGNLSEMQMDEEQKEKMESMTRGLMNTEFTFNHDKSFQIKFSDNIPEFMKDLEMLENKKWKFDESKSLVSIGTEEDNYNHMGIYIKIESGTTFFVLDESPFVLMVTRK